MTEQEQTAETPQLVKVLIELELPMTPGKTIMDVMTAAKAILTDARKNGSASGHVVFGRQKFPL